MVGHKSYRLVCGCLVEDTEIEAKEFPCPLVVQYNILRTEVPVDYFDRVVQECQAFTQLENIHSTVVCFKNVYKNTFTNKISA